MKTKYVAVLSTILSATTCLPFANCFSQDSHLSNPDAGQISFVNFDPSKDVFTMSGTRISAAEQSDINGSPYLLTSWTKGTVVFTNGKVYRDGLLQFNLVANQLQFLNKGRPLVFAAPVKSFTLIDTLNNEARSAWFNSGYPPFGQHNENSFYQVLAIGSKLHLLNFVAKHSSDQYQYNGPAKMFYKETEDLLIYDVTANKLHLVTLSGKSVEKALKSMNIPAVEMLTILNAKKLSEEDLIGLINQLNQ